MGGDHYFVGTLDDAALTKTPDLVFNLVYADDCRSTTINTKNIVFPEIIWNVN